MFIKLTIKLVFVKVFLCHLEGRVSLSLSKFLKNEFTLATELHCHRNCHTRCCGRNPKIDIFNRVFGGGVFVSQSSSWVSCVLRQNTFRGFFLIYGALLLILDFDCYIEVY